MAEARKRIERGKGGGRAAAEEVDTSFSGHSYCDVLLCGSSLSLFCNIFQSLLQHKWQRMA